MNELTILVIEDDKTIQNFLKIINNLIFIIPVLYMCLQI